jgi:hypothetical protein
MSHQNQKSVYRSTRMGQLGVHCIPEERHDLDWQPLFGLHSEHTLCGKIPSGGKHTIFRAIGVTRFVNLAICHHNSLQRKKRRSRIANGVLIRLINRNRETYRSPVFKPNVLIVCRIWMFMALFAPAPSRSRRKLTRSRLS